MTDLSNLKVYLNMINEKSKNRLNVTNYTVRTNIYIKKILLKLKKLKLIKDLAFESQKASFKTDKLIDAVFYTKPTETVNLKNYRRVVKQKLKNSVYNSLLITTSKGIKTLKEAISQKIGGYIISQITTRTPMYNQ